MLKNAPSTDTHRDYKQDATGNVSFSLLLQQSKFRSNVQKKVPWHIYHDRKPYIQSHLIVDREEKLSWRLNIKVQLSLSRFAIHTAGYPCSRFIILKSKATCKLFHQIPICYLSDGFVEDQGVIPVSDMCIAYTLGWRAGAATYEQREMIEILARPIFRDEEWWTVPAESGDVGSC